MDNDNFVTVVVTATGRKQRVPRHYLNHPILGRGIRVAPSQAEQDRLAAGPSEEWTVSQLVDYANTHGVDLGDASKKADVLAAIELARDEQNIDSRSGAAGASEETPATGD